MFPVTNPTPPGERDERHDAPAPGASVPDQPRPPLGTETRPNRRIRTTVARDNSADVPQVYTGKVSEIPRPKNATGPRMLPVQATPPTRVRKTAQLDDGLGGAC